MFYNATELFIAPARFLEQSARGTLPHSIPKLSGVVFGSSSAMASMFRQYPSFFDYPDRIVRYGRPADGALQSDADVIETESTWKTLRRSASLRFTTR